MTATLQIPGQVPIRFHHLPSETAHPAVVPVAMQAGVEVFVSGGVSKLQAIAAIILAGNMLVPTSPEKLAAQVEAALQVAGMLLRLTENQREQAPPDGNEQHVGHETVIGV